MRLDWSRYSPLKASLSRAFIFAKLGNHGNLSFLDNEETTCQPNSHCSSNDHAESDFRLTRRRATRTERTATFTTASFAAKQATETIVEITPDRI
jgi:hypothetical protein